MGMFSGIIDRLVLFMAKSARGDNKHIVAPPLGVWYGVGMVNSDVAGVVAA